MSEHLGPIFGQSNAIDYWWKRATEAEVKIKYLEGLIGDICVKQLMSALDEGHEYITHLVKKGR